MQKKDVAEKIGALVNPDKDNLQISERTIDETLDTLMPLVKEDETIDDFVKRIHPIFNTIAGNVRKDVSDIVAKVKKKEGKDEKIVSEVSDDKAESVIADAREDEDTDVPSWAKSLLDKVKELELSNAEINRQVAAKKNQKEILDEASKIYPPAVVELASLDFDFSGEDAKTKFDKRLSVVANKMNVKPSNAKSNQTNDYSDFYKKVYGDGDFENL